MPRYADGTSEDLMAFLAENIKWPDELAETCIQGRVVVSFLVDLDGTTSDYRVERSFDPLLDEEALKGTRDSYTQ